MPEDLNAEIAGTVVEGARQRSSTSRRDQVVEILEAIVLAIVAVATAWSGFQAARWDGRQAELYAEDAALKIEADQLITLGGQQRLLDVSTFNTWIEAESEGNRELAALYERRFSPEFKEAFDAWVVLDPFSNPDAPPGPSFMPQYVNPQIEQGLELNQRAAQVFEEGTAARDRAHDFTGTTVILATVLFLLAISQRFGMSNVRLAMLVVAGGLMLYGLITVITLQRA